MGALAASMKAPQPPTFAAAAFAGETHEYTDMYPGMAKEAREEDFEEIPDFVRRGR